MTITTNANNDRVHEVIINVPNTSINIIWSKNSNMPGWDLKIINSYSHETIYHERTAPAEILSEWLINPEETYVEFMVYNSESF